MKLLNLDKMAVVEKPSASIVELKVTYDTLIDTPLAVLRNKIDTALNIVAKTADPTQYLFTIEARVGSNDENETADETDAFETFINVALAEFFKHITIKEGKGRPRERRLAVPENLKLQLAASQGLIKDAINYRTLVDEFNVLIQWSAAQLQYSLIVEVEEVADENA